MANRSLVVEALTAETALNFEDRAIEIAERRLEQALAGNHVEAIETWTRVLENLSALELRKSVGRHSGTGTSLH